MSETPIEMLFDRAAMRCTICNKPSGTCNCWITCSCGWSFRRGKRCQNPETKRCSGKLSLARAEGRAE